LNRFISQVSCAILLGATNTYTRVRLGWLSSERAKAGPAENEPDMSQHEDMVTIGSDPKEQEDRRLRERMARIRRRLVVVSGKGGVGKSTAAANLTVALSSHGHSVGLLDVDLHGPSIPKILGCEGVSLNSDGQSILPAVVRDRLALMSIAFLIGSKTDAVIWRGPMKFKVIQQFLSDVVWGDLDYLVVDCPPGTGDEPLAVAHLVGRPAAAVVVTTPQELALADVRRCLNFCQKAGLAIAGVLENMSGSVCPHCGVQSDLFGMGGGQRLAEEMSVPFLGRIPIDPRVVGCGDTRNCILDAHPASPAAVSYLALARSLDRQEELWQQAESEPVTSQAAP
jgi:ATP-binding protein involved in chromosome partitioning